MHIFPVDPERHSFRPSYIVMVTGKTLSPSRYMV